MRWQTGQKFLVDDYNEWTDIYIWYLEIVHFDSRNHDGEIDVQVRVEKFNEAQTSLGTVTVDISTLEQEISDNDLEEIDSLSADQKTNVPTERNPPNNVA